MLLGRHVVLPGGSLAIIGRNLEENGVLDRFLSRGVRLEAQEVPGPTTLALGEPPAADLEAAARLTARYGQGRSRSCVAVGCRWPDGRTLRLEVPPSPPPGCRILKER